MTTCLEVKRELRWTLYSWTLPFVVLIGILFGAWGAQASLSNLELVTEHYERVLNDVTANGGTLEEALAEPVVITQGPGGTEVIDNVLRFRYEELEKAKASLTPTGQALNTLSIACVLLFPFVGFTAGVFIATHDRRTGAVVLRWPQCSIPAFVASKVMALAAMIFALATAAAVTSAILGATWASSGPGAGAPPLAKVIAVAVFVVAIGTAFGAVGLLAGSLYSGRTLSVLTCFALMYMLPLQGTFDPRVWITVSGQHILEYPGPLRLPTTGNSLMAGTGLAALGILAIIGLYLAWRYRDRMPYRVIG